MRTRDAAIPILDARVSEPQMYRNKGNSADKLCHTRTDEYSAEQVLLKKQQVCGGGAYLHCYQKRVKIVLPSLS